MEIADYRYVDPLVDLLAVLAYGLPALAIFLYGRNRSPKLTRAALRIAAGLYVAWLLILSPNDYLFEQR